MKLFERRNGFTLLALLIIVAILAILALTAVPSYLAYLREVNFKATVLAAEQLKSVVISCIQKHSNITACSQGKNGIPRDRVATNGQPGVSVSNGTITAIAPPDAHYGVAGATYILTPYYSTQEEPVYWHIQPHSIKRTIHWHSSGTGCVQDYADC